MKLLTKELREQLPPLYACENDPDPLVRAKFFYPDFSWTWYAIEFDGEDIFFGLVSLITVICQSAACPDRRNLPGR